MVAEQSAGDGAIGPVPGAGAREAAVQFDLGALRRASGQCARDQAEAAGTGGVRGGRPHHHGTEDVEQRHHDRQTSPAEPTAPSETAISVSSLPDGRRNTSSASSSRSTLDGTPSTSVPSSRTRRTGLSLLLA